MGLILMDGAMFSESLIQFSVVGGAVFSPCYLPGANYGGRNEDNGDFLQKVPCTHCCTQCPQPCNQRHLDTKRQVWGSLSWDHCSFLLGPGGHEILFVPANSLFPSPVKFWRLYDGLNGDLLQEGLAIPRSAAPRARAPEAVHC